MPVYERSLRAYGRLLDVCLRHRAATVARLPRGLRARRCCWFRSSAPSSCRTSTKARCGCARRCRTRSPSTRRRSSDRRSATSCSSFPQVTTVANELGRPDDGTDPIGFFNDEYFVGLKPYDDPAWSGSIRTKPQLIDAIQKKLEAFPGHHLQLHAAGRGRGGRSRDRPQELAGREDLRHRSRDARDEGRRGPARDLRRFPASRTSSLVRELGQPSLTIEPDRAKIARYGLNVADINALIETAVGGTPATQVIQGER